MSESVMWLLLDTRRAKKQGPTAIEERQHTRLAEMVSFARSNLPYYRELYQDLPVQVEEPTLLPVTSKQELMARINDWVTDREVTIKQARAFVDDPDLIGERFLGRYTLLTTSGTTGARGIFVLDDRNIAVTGALAFRMLSACRRRRNQDRRRRQAHGHSERHGWPLRLRGSRQSPK
jgi:phenylacetate-CoA ligase